MVKIACLDDRFLEEVFLLQASPVEVQSLQQKGEKRTKRKVKKNSTVEKPKDI